MDPKRGQYYRFLMRFRPKFGVIGWFTVAPALFICMLWMNGGNHLSRFLPYIAVTWALMALLRVSSYLFVFWQMDSDGLFERRFWNTRVIPWSDVVLIQGLGDVPSSDYVEVFVQRAGPEPEAHPLLANPRDRAQFLAALHRYASQARFDA